MTCVCDEDTCTVTCDVTIDFWIGINRFGDKPRSWIPHERRHAMSRTMGVKRRIVNPLRKEEPSAFDKLKPCQDQAERLQKKYQDMFDEYTRKGNHRKNRYDLDTGKKVEKPDGGANDYSPWENGNDPPISDEELDKWLKAVNADTEARPATNPG